MPSYGNITKTREEALKKLYSSLKKCILEVWKKNAKGDIKRDISCNFTFLQRKLKLFFLRTISDICKRKKVWNFSNFKHERMLNVWKSKDFEKKKKRKITPKRVKLVKIRVDITGRL